MKNLIQNIAGAVLGLVLLVGCQSNNPPASGAGKASDTSDVALLYSQAAKPYDELGTVSTLKVQSEPGMTWQRAIQKQAAGLGANAVVINTATLNNSYTPMVTGTAIRYK
jgi:hypothetical protein